MEAKVQGGTVDDSWPSGNHTRAGSRTLELITPSFAWQKLPTAALWFSCVYPAYFQTHPSSAVLFARWPSFKLFRIYIIPPSTQWHQSQILYFMLSIENEFMLANQLPYTFQKLEMRLVCLKNNLEGLIGRVYSPNVTSDDRGSMSLRRQNDFLKHPNCKEQSDPMAGIKYG